jgi:hypothetical protein
MDPDAARKGGAGKETGVQTAIAIKIVKPTEADFDAFCF